MVGVAGQPVVMSKGPGEGAAGADWRRIPAGLFIDASDISHIAASESRNPVGYGYNPDAGATSGAEGIWVDRGGMIYGARVKERPVARHIRVKSRANCPKGRAR